MSHFEDIVLTILLGTLAGVTVSVSIYAIIRIIIAIKEQ